MRTLTRNQSFGVLFCVLGVVATTGCKRAKARLDTSSTTEATETANEAPIDGVSSEEVRLVQVASLTGAQAGLGTETYRGAMAYFLEVNSKGGIHGRKITVVPMDDKYTQEGGEQATEKVMTDERQPFALFSASGTEPTTGILKVLKKYESKKMFLWGSTSGADVSRVGEYAPFAFNIRGSLRGAGKDICDAYAQASIKRLGLVTQDDGFGKSAATATRKAAEEHGMEVVLELPIAKTLKPEAGNANDIVAKMRAANVEGIVLAATYNPSATFIRDAREKGWNVPAATMGTPDTMLRFLVAHEKKTGKRMTNAVLGCTNAPPVNAIELAAVREYRDLVDRRNPQLPSEIADPNYRALRYGSNALEGFLSAKVFAEALERAGKNLTRESFRKAAESIQGWDPGVGQRITFNSGDNQGFDSIWLNGIKNDEFALPADMKKYLTDKPEPVTVAKGEKEKDVKEPAAANAKTSPAVAATPAKK